MNSKSVWYFLVLLVAVAALVVCAVAGKAGEVGWHDQRVFEGTSVRLPAPASAAVVVGQRGDTPLALDAAGESARLPPEAHGAAIVRVTPRDAPDKSVELRVSIVRREYGFAAGIAGVVVSLMLLLLAGSGKSVFEPLWLAISEQGGGLSLGRTQLLLWFVPAIVMFTALSVPLLELPRIDGSFAILFGLAGLTGVVGGAASPSQATVGTPGDAKVKTPGPELVQLITNWNKEIDISRVQYLAISVVGTVVLLGAFASDMRVPAIPEGFLALIGVSQAAYLGGKAVSGPRDAAPQKVA